MDTDYYALIHSKMYSFKSIYDMLNYICTKCVFYNNWKTKVKQRILQHL